MFLSNFGWLGKAGGWIEEIQKGLFGALSYVFPVFLLFFVFHIRSVKTDPFGTVKNISLVIIFLMAAVLVHIAFGTRDELTFKELYELGKAGEFSKGAAGGAIGGVLASVTTGAVGRVGTVLIAVFITIVCLVFVTEKSIVEFLKKGADKTAQAAKTGAVKTAQYARKGSGRLKEKIAQDRLDREMRAEALRLRRMEEGFDDAKVDPSSSRFDINTHHEDLKPYAGDLSGFGKEENVPAAAEDPGIPVPPEAETDLSEPAADFPAEPDYEVDTVPFEETVADKYRTYEKIMEGGRIDIRDAKTLGFAVSSDDGEDFLHRPLAPDEIVYPEMDGTGESFPEIENEEPEDTYEEIPETVFPEPADLNDFPEEPWPDDFPEEPQPDDIPAEPYPEVFPEEPVQDDLPEEVLPAPKPKKSPEQAQAELDKKREEEKQKATAVKVRPYQFPPIGLLAKGMRAEPVNMQETAANSRKLEQVLREFGVGVRVTNVVRGPRVTRYEVAPDVGVKVSRITALADDIKLALAATDLRIEAPIPGKSAVGIEVPNDHSSMVTFRDILDTKELKDAKSKLSWGVGLDIQGTTIVGNIAKMPHLLISGTTGSGKSVAVNTIIMSILYRATPEEVKMILVDPKVVELSPYDGIPHLLTPVVTKPSEALNVLNKACEEMNRRYRLFKESNTRNIDGYNEKAKQVAAMLPEGAEKPEHLPYILIVIDELAELMQHAKKDVESAIASLTQLARAAGIHLVVVTQRPSVDVVTGLIKSNIPSRVALKLPTLIDSRTILDSGGAETLLGNGDMLYKPGDVSSPLRLQGAYMSDEEVENIIEWIKKHNSTVYDKDWEESLTAVTASEAGTAGTENASQGDGHDELFVPSGDLITEKKKASIGMLQRRFKIGFNRAARIMDELCDAGVVGDSEGTKERQILMTNEEFRERFGYEETY